MFATFLIIFLKRALMASSADRILGWRSFCVTYCHLSSSHDLFSQPLSYLPKFSFVTLFHIPDSLCLTPKRVNNLFQRTQLQALIKRMPEERRYALKYGEEEPVSLRCFSSCRLQLLLPAPGRSGEGTISCH